MNLKKCQTCANKRFVLVGDGPGNLFKEECPDCAGYIENLCDHEGHVVKGECEKCGERGLESDAETYEKENPR